LRQAVRGSRSAMTRWTDRLFATLGIRGRKPEADVSAEPAKRGPGRDETTLGTTGKPQEPPEVQGNPGSENR
jgi:hypothetical protein